MQKRKERMDILKSLTLEEKARLVNGDSFFGMTALKDKGIPRIQLLDGGTGINFEQLFGDIVEVEHLDFQSTNGMDSSSLLNSVIQHYYEPEMLSEEELYLHTQITESLKKRLNGQVYSPGCFPPGILLGATWNKEIVEEVGNALGMEAGLFGIDILLGTPNVNIHRDPLNGRLFEGYSEDPYLVSQLAPQLVKGVQKQGVAANVKHFAANNQETNRIGVDETISRRALEEIFLPGFRACVTDGYVRTVMSAYNKINHVPCTENKWLLTEKLRNEWGFDGVVVSDWEAVYHDTAALQAGNDLAMPGPRNWKVIYDAVRHGELDEKVLDTAVYRILSLIDWLQNSGKKKTEQLKQNDTYQLEELYNITTKAAYKAACEGIVLVENQDILPLSEGTSIELAGSAALQILDCGTGSAGITTNRTSSLESRLKDLGLKIENKTAAGNALTGNSSTGNPSESNPSVIICVCGLNGMEGNDRADMQLCSKDLLVLARLGALDPEKLPDDVPGSVAEEIRQIMNSENESDLLKKDVILLLNVCGPVDLSYLNRSVVKAVLIMFLTGMEGGNAAADIICGKVNPSGKLPLTFPLHYKDTPTYLNFPGDGKEVCYGEGIYVGYRYYDKKDIRPLYPFGFGLSYTTFTYGDIEELAINTRNKNTGDSCNDNEISFSIQIKNSDQCDGAQVIQIYIADPYSTLPKPRKELKAFKKVYLKAGESTRVEFKLTSDSFASFDPDLCTWTIEEGYYDIIVATSSDRRDIIAQSRIYLDGPSPYNYGLNSTIKTLYENEQINKLMQEIFQKKGLDYGVVENSYQYTSGKTLREVILEMASGMNIKDQELIMNNPDLKEFLNKISKMKRA